MIDVLGSSVIPSTSPLRRKSRKGISLSSVNPPYISEIGSLVGIFILVAVGLGRVVGLAVGRAVGTGSASESRLIVIPQANVVSAITRTTFTNLKCFPILIILNDVMILLPGIIR